MIRSLNSASILLTILWLTLVVGPGQAYAQEHGQGRIDSIDRVVAGSREDTQKVKLLSELSFSYQNTDPASGLKYGNMGLALARKLGWKKGMAICYSNIALNYTTTADFTEAMDNYAKAMRIYIETGDKKGTAAVYSNMGIVYTMLSNYTQATEAFTRALDIYEELGDRSAVARAYGNLSNVYAEQANYSLALENCFKALHMYEEINETAGIATITVNIGIIYNNIGDNKKALAYLDKALKLVIANGNKVETGKVTLTIGNVYKDLKDYSKAMSYYAWSLKITEEIGNKQGSASTIGNIGNVYDESGDYRNATKAYLEAGRRFEEAEDRAGVAGSIGNAGEVYLKIAKKLAADGKIPDTAIIELAVLRGAANSAELPAGKDANLKLAIEFLERGRKLAIETSYLEAIEEFTMYLSEAYELYGDKDKALQAHKQYTAIKDSIHNRTNRIKIAQLETEREVLLKNKQLEIDKLEVAKKRNERVFFIAGIILLLAVGGIIFRNMRLKAAKELSENKLNAFQARMNPHFIFNALSSIQSLIMNDEKEPSIDYLSEFSTLMRKILDNSTSSKVPLKTEVEMLQSYIQLEHLRFNSFKWQINIDDKLLNETVSVPGMIVQPFVENAILHGFMNRKKDGVLTINFERTDKQVICTVDDNGIGRAKSAELNAERNKHRQSHGINIAANRLALLSDNRKGLVNKVTYIDKMENGIPAGTKVIIELPAL